jgi:hypothetical protein
MMNFDRVSEMGSSVTEGRSVISTVVLLVGRGRPLYDVLTGCLPAGAGETTYFE